MRGVETAGTMLQMRPLHITPSVVTTWGIMLALVFFSWAVGRRLRREPGPLQAALEGAMGAIDDAIRAVLPDHVERILPFIATLWIFILLANLTGLIPGLQAPTSDLSVTAALAVLVFLSVHWFGISIEGITQYLRHYLTPSPLLLPFHIISEISRTLTLAVRLFGNMMSLEMAALLVVMVAGFLAPIPLLMLHIVEALIQAYIFGMLALIYLAGAIQTRALHSPSEKG
ncbi:MAG: F0F1 ATP synthase subunit A [Nitrospira sp. LK70]|nr:F0F1 ATP synthase subunit A [Nitrospira sp. LK70]